jgi:uncharacterized delta-60 repeat protein
MNIGMTLRLSLTVIVLAIAACGGGGDDESSPAPPPPPPPPSGIGAAGGTVTGPNGSSVQIPAGALATSTAINVAQGSAGMPPLPAGFTAIGQMFLFTPHGTTFAVPVTVTLPFDPATVPAGRTPVLLKTNGQNQWVQVPNATFGASSVTGQITSFSGLTGAIPPLVRNDPVRTWTFAEYRGDALERVELASETAPPGELRELFDFGPAIIDADWVEDDGTVIPPDGIASGEVFSTADGITFWVFAESPSGDAGNAEAPVGGITHLTQAQSFVKRANDASLDFTISSVILNTTDLNAVIDRVCVNDGEGSCDLIKAEVLFDARADTHGTEEVPSRSFFHTAGFAYLRGFADSWVPDAGSFGYSRTPLWAGDHFEISFHEFFGVADADVFLEMIEQHKFVLDLSDIEVCPAATPIEECEEFTLTIVTTAHTWNRISGPPSEFATAASAWLRDPQRIGGTAVTFTGLEPTNAPLLALPEPSPVEPEPCVPGPGPDPAAGVLQFSAATYQMVEANTTPTIRVTRTGGSTGAVTATFTSSDGTAVAEVDYEAVNNTVFFADGDTQPRYIAVPLIDDQVAGEPDKTVTLTLSQPGGCTALGTPSTAVLTIRDDEPAPQVSGLDPSFDGDGRATVEGFGGDRSAMALQEDGRIVMVGGTFTDFVMARFDPDGSLDDSFGDSGRVTTNMVNNEQEEALGVAIQDDGKIVVVGYTGQAVGPSVFAVARYDTDGSPDDSFGVDGKVVTGVTGQAFAVAIQPDGRIVVGGRIDGDIQLARYTTNGTLDGSFGIGGVLAVPTDIVGDADAAANIVLLPTGEIVVSGGSSVGGTPDVTGLARYLPNGSLDNSFGIGGKVTLTERVGEGLVRQSDGKLVLVGHVETAEPPATRTLFAVMRLDANGGVDDEFGDQGLVTTAITERGEAALAVALDADGRIVAAGRSSAQTNSNFAVARYLTDGTLDEDFGDNGVLTIDFFGFGDVAESVAIQPNGRIVLGGLARDLVDGYGLARVVP